MGLDSIQIRWVKEEDNLEKEPSTQIIQVDD